jgi:hypothetical protein
MSETAPQFEEPKHPSVRAEPTDLSFRSVMGFFAGLAVSLVLISAGSWGMVVYLTGREADQKRSDSLWTAQDQGGGSVFGVSRETRRDDLGEDRSRLPSLPRLEGMEREPFGRELVPPYPGSVQEQMKKEDDRLAGYGWVNRDKGIVHIPIEEAMKKLAGWLPARDGKDVNEFLDAPSRSSSGTLPRGGK